MPDTVALPFSHDGRVVAVIELSEIGMAIDPVALDGLLDLTRMSLEPLARPLDEAAIEQRIEPRIAPSMDPSARFSADLSAELSAERSAESLAEPAAALPPPASAGARAVTMKDAQVLVVEDNVTQTEATARLLRRLGCRVTLASGMLAGLQALCETQFDLVLMDTAMPGVGAQEALAWLRGQPQGAFRFVSTSDTPVVAMAPQGLPGDVERFRELGFDDCLFKPLRHDALSAMLIRHLRARSPALDGGAGSGMPAASAGALDAAALDRLRELDPSGQNHLVERVLKAFQTSAARLLPQLQAAHAARDNANVRLVAHTLKSSSASIGALALSHLCAQLENAIRNEQADEIDGGVAAMTASLHATLESIRQMLEETT
jgi:CheY-like chemotaxis protein